MRKRDTSAAIYILLSVGRSYRSEDDLQLLMQAAVAIYILLQSLPWMLKVWKLFED